MQDIDKIMNITESIQKECHKFIEDLTKKYEEQGHKKIPSYQDLTNVFFFMKIAQLQKDVADLKRTQYL